MSSASSARTLPAAIAAVALAVAMVASVTAPAAAQSAAPPTGSSVSVVDLEVENRSSPLGIDVAAPRFSWVVGSDERDVVQTSYRLRVATAADALDGSADVWDSGTVESGVVAGVEYGGPALEASTTYHWRVDVSTSAGSATGTSLFATGLFDEEDWAGSSWIGRERIADDDRLGFDGASWIWTPEAGAPYAPAEDRAFRRTLTTPAGKDAVSAEIAITADDSYALWVNGTLLGRTAGAENEWQGSKAYTVDLAADENVFAVLTKNGPNSPAGLLIAIRVTYSDGSTEIVHTDATWRGVKQVPGGFEAPSFDDSAWPAAAVQAPYGSGPWGSGVRAPSRKPAPAPLLRKEFAVEGDVTSAKIYVAAGGYADVSLNGAPINDEILSPGFTDYDDHAQYTVTDLTDQVREGRNTLGMELGRGFYGMTNGNVWRWESAPFHDEPVARAVLRVEYENGSTEDIVTDASWTLHDGPTVLDDLYGGETYDARLVQPGFDTVGFDDSSWVAASEVDGPAGELINQAQQPIRVTERLAADSIDEVAPGTWVVGFPRVLAGTVEFAVQGPAGTEVRAQYGEKLLADGRPDFSNNGGFQNGFQTDRFVLAGTGAEERWGGRFSYKGFQYIEVTGWPGDEAPPLSAFTAKVLHTDAERTGSFESSNATMNAVHEAVVDTLLNNIHSIPTDTPMFEKNGWTGDASVGAEMFMLNLDTRNLFSKWMGDVNDTRDENGAPLVIAPSSGDWGQWGVAPPWHSAYVLIPWWLYQYGGDERVLARYYDGMKAYVDLEFSRSPGGIADTRLGDWVAPEASPAGGNPPEDLKVSATAYLYTMLTSMQKSATLLGRSADAADLGQKAAVVKDAFNARFLDAERGYYRGSGDVGYRQTHNVLALAFGLAPDEAMQQRVAASIAADVVAKGDKLNTGTLGTKYLLPVLTDNGYAELAYAVATQTGYPSWGYMIENGATSMWEHWSLEARSRGHYFLGTVDDWFYHDVAGIEASETTGYRDITIEPAVTDQLDWAKATTETPFGDVSVDWRTEGDRLRLAASVPVGSTATVKLPASTTWAVTEGGVALTDVAGVRSVSSSGTTVSVVVGSGDYSFEVDASAEPTGAVLDRLAELQAEADARPLTSDVAEDIASLVSAARESAIEALRQISSPRSAAVSLTSTLDALDGVDALLAGDRVDPESRVALQSRADAARDAAGASISSLLGVSATAIPSPPSVRAGDRGELQVTITNGAEASLGESTAELVEPSAWATGPAELSAGLAPLETAAGRIAFAVPADAAITTVPARVVVEYLFDGTRVRLAAGADIVVDSPLSISSLTIDPASVSAGESALVTAVVQNAGSTAATGRLVVRVPDGWRAPLPGDDVVVPAGEQVTVSVPVFAPRDIPSAPWTTTIAADFERDGIVYASASAELVVTLPPISEPAVGYDHIDLGEQSSESAHSLTASASSGANVEAGLTRRYSGHLTDFSAFEFDAAVIAGEPFAIRSVETYDSPQTKRYRVYVDDTEVTERLFSHTGGVGTETWQFDVAADLATDDSVRIRFENLDDHTFYDPSIADVWTLPVADDDVAPQLRIGVDPGADASGWVRSPVLVSVDALDDRDASPGVEYALGDNAYESYRDPVPVEREGETTVRARATDAAGNATESSAIVRIDTVAPTTEAELGDGFDGDTADGSGTVDFRAVDGSSGVASTAWRVDGGEWASGSSATVDRPGPFTLQYYSTDRAGNIEPTREITGRVVVADTAPPTVEATVSNPGSAGWYLAGAAVTLTAQDEVSGVSTVEYRLGAGAWTAYERPVSLPDGRTEFAYRATDGRGNTTPAASITVRVDSRAPSAWVWLNSSGRVIAVASDTGSGPDRIQYRLDGGDWVDSLSRLIDLDRAPSRLHYRAVDVSGNVGETAVATRSGTPPRLTVTPGSRLLVEASGFLPGTVIRVELHSDPIVVGAAEADARGVVSAFGDVPADFPAGDHQVVLAVVDDGTGGTGGAAVSIPAGTLAETGASTAGGWLALIATLLGAGGLLIVVRRRMRLGGAGGRRS